MAAAGPLRALLLACVAASAPAPAVGGDGNNAGDGNSGREHPAYGVREISAESMAALIPERPSFASGAELEHACRHAALVLPGGLGRHAVSAQFEDFRLRTIDFYGSGYTLLGPDALLEAILAQKRVVAEICPLALMQALVLQIETLLVSVYQGTAENRNAHMSALSEASVLNAEVDLLRKWLVATLPGMDVESIGAWPIKRGFKRCHRYYDILWDDVHDSKETWAIMEQPGDISDELYHAALRDVADVLDSLGGEVDWWPCRGTLIALMRHGARSGSLSRGFVDVVERDIDVMLGIASEAAWIMVERVIEQRLRDAGWDRCWGKTSADGASFNSDETRRDLLYCVRTSPAYVLLDVTSYINGAPGDNVFVHRVCPREGDANNCTVPADVGPLRHGGGILRKDAIYPLARCRAGEDLAVPCPRDPLVTIRAMAHSGLDAGCVALPDVKARSPEEESTRQLQAAGGLCAEDVGILRERSSWLHGMGFQSMAPLFSQCNELAQILAIPC